MKAVPLEVLAQIRGAMWTARLDLPWGHRPGQPSNVICIDYFECYSALDQARIIAAYGPASARGYTHAPMGPIVDRGYHDELPATDWRSSFHTYLNAAEKLEKAGIHVIHFLRPDAGAGGLEWDLADLERELVPLFTMPRAQALMQIVCLGWEPGPKYRYPNQWWVTMLAWQALTFPNALRLIHMTEDTDAPAGGNDDRMGLSNGQAWANVSPYLHGWLVQNGGYTGSGNPVPTKPFVKDFTDQFRPNLRGSLVERFRTGGPPGDWPTGSAWGFGEPLRVYAGEFASFAAYWQDWPETEARGLGRLAIAAGASGSFDGC